MLFTNANYCVEKTNHKYPHHMESKVNDLPHLHRILIDNISLLNLIPLTTLRGSYIDERLMN